MAEHIASGSTYNSAIFGDAISVFDKVFDFHGTLDPEGIVLSLSGRIFESTNTNPELLKGQRFSETVFWQSSELTPRLLEKTIERAVDGESGKLILDFRVSADDKIAVEVFVQRIDASDTNGVIFIGGQSVSPRKELLESTSAASEQLLFAAENAEIGLWFWDFREDRIYATARCNELFELSAYGSFRYSDYRTGIHPDDRDFVDDFLARSRSDGTSYEEEFRLLYSDGSIEWISAEGKSIIDDDGKPERMLGVVQKISEQKYASEELARVHEREKRARQEAVDANRAKDFFLAFVSHELRSPLNAILGWAKILLSKNVDAATLKNALEIIERSARFQTKLINDLVDSARVASGKLRLEYRATNLFEIVRNSVDAQKPSADARNISLRFSSDKENVPLFGDSNRLQQVFGNLISNAIKFTPEAGWVSVEIQTGTDTVNVHVSDSGNGIDPAALPHVFKQFSQGDVDQAKTNVGLGLGLSIVKILVTKHGGVVQAESEGMGKGSKFTVTLPLTESAVLHTEADSGPLTTGKKVLKGILIFIVEDDADSREVLHLFLEQNGAAVRSFGSVRAALAAIRDASAFPDLIISDLGMPEEDGYSLIRQIRELLPEHGGNIPAMALSAFTSAESRQRALELGFNRYSTKPFEHDMLVNDLLELLESSKIASAGQ